MLMHKVAVLSLVSALCFGVTSAAHADSYTLTVTGPGVSASAMLYGSPDSVTPNAEDISSVYGTVNGVAINSLVSGDYNPTSPTNLILPVNALFVFDNLLYTSGPVFDHNGLLVKLANGEYFNFFYDGNGETIIYDNDANSSAIVSDISINFGASATPEPSSLLLLATGCAGIAAAARRRLRFGAAA